MASFIFKDAHLEVDGVDLSNRVQQVALNINAELQDETAMGNFTRINKPGLEAWSIDVTFKQDFATGNVDEVLYDLTGSSAFPVTLRPKKASAVSSINPNYTGQAVIENYNPLSGAVGDLAQATVTFRSAGDLERNTS